MKRKKVYHEHKKLFMDTEPELLDLWARVMEKRFAARWTTARISKEFGLPLMTVYRILYKYKAPVTGRKVELLITSKV